jgi:hypothetical protein
MKSLFIAFLVGGTLTASSIARVTKTPYTLTIAAKNAGVKAGEPIEIEVTRHNTSNKNVDCGAAYSESFPGVDLSLEYIVRDESGALLERKSPENDRLKGHAAGSFKACTLPPGETSYNGGGQISSLYDMTKPGHYTVQAIQHDSDKENKTEVGRVKSNVITVTVIP